MKKEKFDAEGIVKMNIEYDWFCDFYDDEEDKRYKNYGGLSKDERIKIEDRVQKEIEAHIASGVFEGDYTWRTYEDGGSYVIGYTFAVVSDGNPEVVFEGHHGHHHAAEMEMTPDIMDYPGLPVVPDSYGTNSALDSGNGVPQWYGSAESYSSLRRTGNRGYGQLRYNARFDRDQTGEQDFLQNYYVRYTVFDIDNDKTYNDLPSRPSK